MHVTECMSNNKFRKIKLKSFFQLSGVITVSFIISLKQYLKIVDKRFLYFFSNHHSYIYIHYFVDICDRSCPQKLNWKVPSLTFKGFFQNWQNWIFSFNLKPVTLLLQVCSQWQNDVTRWIIWTIRSRADVPGANIKHYSASKWMEVIGWWIVNIK